MVVMEPELAGIVGSLRSGIDAVNIELPVAGVNRALNWDAVANFPLKSLSGPLADNCAFAVVQESFPLIVRHHEFRIHQPPAFRLNRELRKEILLVLIDSAEPGSVSDLFNARHRSETSLIGFWKRLNKSNTVHHNQSIGARNFHALIERDA